MNYTRSYTWTLNISDNTTHRSELAAARHKITDDRITVLAVLRHGAYLYSQ